MAELFERVSINGMKLANRFVRSATWEGLADQEGSVTPKLTAMMVELAKGEVGLIVSGYAFVSPEGRRYMRPKEKSLCKSSTLEGLRTPRSLV